MDAKVHPARPVHRNAVGMIGLVRRDLRPQTTGESVDPGADRLDAAARRNSREQFPAQDRGFHRWA